MRFGKQLLSVDRLVLWEEIDVAAQTDLAPGQLEGGYVNTYKTDQSSVRVCVRVCIKTSFYK